MNTAPATRPRFFWQGVLIVLPVAVLAIFALVLLQQDKAMVDHETRDKAQAEADETAERLWATFDDPALRASFQIWHRTRWTIPTSGESVPKALSSAYVFQIDDDGQLLFPPPLRELPQPQPLKLSDLNEEQAARWRAAQSGVIPSSASQPDAIENLRQLIALKPPDSFAAVARFQLGVLLARSHQPGAAAQEFQNWAQAFPEFSGESGIPLLPLALLKAAEQLLLAPRAGGSSAPSLLNAACSNAVAVPSSITPSLLRAALPLDAKVATNLAVRWQALWRQHQVARLLQNAARPAYGAAVVNAARQRTDVANQSVSPSTHQDGRQARTIPPRLFWFGLPRNFPAVGDEQRRPSGNIEGTEFWLATWIDSDTNGHWYSCRPRLARSPGARSISHAVRAGGREVNRDSLSFETSIVDPTGTLERSPLPTIDPLLAEVERRRAQLPEYFGLSVQLAGRAFISSNELPSVNDVGGRFSQKSARATGSAPPLLASAVRLEDGLEMLRVGIHLTNPEMLYARQDARNRLFGLLIGASALAAVIGFASARRAFRRQQQLAEMKSNFVSSVSHELRAPIASVRLLAESLERGKISEPGKQQEYFRFIVQECRRLGSLIENVLDFARIEQGRKQYEFEPTDVAQLVGQTVQLMEPAATEREVALCFKPPFPEDSPPPRHPAVDGAALQQALVNLLDNAIKHSPPRTTVAIGLEHRGQPPALLLSVQDQGPGIPSAEHDKIFERFYRRGSELRRETQGVGIGLSIVKHIVQAHGGRVRVVSEPGQGSLFVIELPVEPTRVSK